MKQFNEQFPQTIAYININGREMKDKPRQKKMFF